MVPRVAVYRFEKDCLWMMSQEVVSITAKNVTVVVVFK